MTIIKTLIFILNKITAQVRVEIRVFTFPCGMLLQVPPLEFEMPDAKELNAVTEKKVGKKDDKGGKRRKFPFRCVQLHATSKQSSSIRTA